MDSYYDSIAEGYNELHGEEQLRKLAVITSHVEPEGTLLDVGCGTGISTDYFSTLCECTGIDPSAELIGQNITEKSTFIVGSAESLPFSDGEFDWVVSLTAVQNFSDIGLGLSEMKRVGSGNYVITWLRKSSKSDFIENEVRDIFGTPSKILDDKHDVIFLYE